MEASKVNYKIFNLNQIFYWTPLNKNEDTILEPELGYFIVAASASPDTFFLCVAAICLVLLGVCEWLCTSFEYVLLL